MFVCNSNLMEISFWWYGINKPLSSMKKGFNYLCHFSVGEWYNMQIHINVFQNNFSESMVKVALISLFIKLRSIIEKQHATTETFIYNVDHWLRMIPFIHCLGYSIHLNNGFLTCRCYFLSDLLMLMQYIYYILKLDHYCEFSSPSNLWY